MNDREKLIDLIIDAKRRDQETGSFTEFLADHMIENGVTVQKWIPVSDMLPRFMQIVLVTDGKYVYKAALNTKKNG